MSFSSSGESCFSFFESTYSAIQNSFRKPISTILYKKQLIFVTHLFVGKCRAAGIFWPGMSHCQKAPASAARIHSLDTKSQLPRSCVGVWCLLVRKWPCYIDIFLSHQPTWQGAIAAEYLSNIPSLSLPKWGPARLGRRPLALPIQNIPSQIMLKAVWHQYPAKSWILFMTGFSVFLKIWVSTLILVSALSNYLQSTLQSSTKIFLRLFPISSSHPALINHLLHLPVYLTSFLINRLQCLSHL